MPTPTFTGVADLLAEEVTQQHPDEGGAAAQIIRQEEVDGDQFQTVGLGRVDNSGDNTAEQIPLPALPQGRVAVGTDAGEGRRSPGRVRKKPSRCKDFEMDESG